MANFIFLIGVVLLMSSCGQRPEKTQYEEIVISPEQPKAKGSTTMTDPHAFMKKEVAATKAEPSISWHAPEGWEEVESSGFRLTTFKAGIDEQIMECSIVSLGPAAGDLKANVQRWMGQIELPMPNEKIFTYFMKNLKTTPTQAGKPATLVDFTLLQSFKKPMQPSMMTAIISLDDQTIFVKMTGAGHAIDFHRELFIELVQSIRVKK